MPNRPPREWFKRCSEDVAAKGTATIPGAVCATVWQRKSAAKKRATVRLEEGDMAKKKKKKNPKRAAPRKKKHKAKRKAKHRQCPYCRHASRHGAAGCTHTSSSGLFCSCKH